MNASADALQMRNRPQVRVPCLEESIAQQDQSSRAPLSIKPNLTYLQGENAKRDRSAPRHLRQTAIALGQ